MKSSRSIEPGLRKGEVVVPPSKSHLHRVLIADFLAGGRDYCISNAGDADDVCATKRCLAALSGTDCRPVLDVGESGSTYRFLAPVAVALGKKPEYHTAGRLAERPQMEYDSLQAGVRELPGNVSSQFVTGLLFALPLLDGDSEIRFASPLESRGYVDMTIDVLRKFGVAVEEGSDGRFLVRGGQRFVSPGATAPEGDWSGAMFWLAMNALGSKIDVDGLDSESAQPDRRGAGLLAMGCSRLDVSQCPDSFPALAVAAAGREGTTLFTGTARLRIKECDRLVAMDEMLSRLGVATRLTDEGFEVCGSGRRFAGGVDVRTFGDHRIAMAAAVAATFSLKPISIDNAKCTAKSYPGFFTVFDSLERIQE